MIYFYNKCSQCKNENIVLIDDVNKDVNEAGGIRALCYKCGRNTKPQAWNEFNPEEEPLNSTE
jgi:hypothetical protein